MNILSWFRRAPVAVALPPREELTPKPMTISQAAVDVLSAGKRRVSPFQGVPKPPPGVRPATAMAMDDASNVGGAWGGWATAGLWGEGLYFPGYPYLAELAQRPEYRNIVETIAEEMTRKWIALKSEGDGDKDTAIKTISDAMKRMDLRGVFKSAMELDGFMGMGIVYIDTGATDDPAELLTPLLLNPGKIGKGALQGFVVVDPTWVSPMAYNSADPLKPDYLVPTTWYVMGKAVHESRLLFFRSREVPDMLKAAYNFGGLSMSQMAKPYVDNWLRTRQSVSDLLHSFTVFILKTAMQSYLQNAAELVKRLQAFVLGRDNQGLMLIDKDTEEFDNVSVPLGGLDALQAQAQEQMASVAQIPLTKLTGITPKGLNASADGEIRIWYDRVHAKQEAVFGAPLTVALKVIQLSELGKIDPAIVFEFLSLWELDAAGQAAVEKMKADTDAVYMTEAVVSNEEVRQRLAADPQSPYHGLAGPAPEKPEEGDVDLADEAEQIGRQGSEKGANSPD